jgi:hypothetical protein
MGYHEVRTGDRLISRVRLVSCFGSGVMNVREYQGSLSQAGGTHLTGGFACPLRDSPRWGRHTLRRLNGRPDERVKVCHAPLRFKSVRAQFPRRLGRYGV